MSDKNTPPILTARSLELTTKVVAIYCAFYLVTVLFKSYADYVSEDASMSQEYIVPMFIIAGLHLVIMLITIFSIIKKQFSWLVTILMICIVLASRIWFEEFAVWINSTF